MTYFSSKRLREGSQLSVSLLSLLSLLQLLLQLFFIFISTIIDIIIKYHHCDYGKSKRWRDGSQLLRGPYHQEIFLAILDEAWLELLSNNWKYSQQCGVKKRDCDWSWTLFRKWLQLWQLIECMALWFLPINL